MPPSFHMEWLSLVETSGPFISLPTLEEAFPQGLERESKDQAGDLRLAHEEWLQTMESMGDPRIHEVWVRFVLTRLLSFSDESILSGEGLPEGCSVPFSEHHETLSPDLVIVPPPDDFDLEGGEQESSPRILVQILEPKQHPERPIPGRAWKASPVSRMEELLRANNVVFGILTNGEDWILVHAPRNETVGTVRWLASLWSEERSTLRAFMSLVGARRLFRVPDEETLEALFAKSLTNQQQLTDQLGLQVRIAVETLVRAIDRAESDANIPLSERGLEKEIYEAALTVMMRLLFLLYAEEQGLLPLGEALYDENYAASTLLNQLVEDADRFGTDVLERRQSAWARLLATFRAIHAGLDHDQLSLSAHGGALFDPDRFAFLEGRAAGTHWKDEIVPPLAIDDLTVLQLLRAIQYLEIGGGRGRGLEARRLSFKELGVEQIGHVYESLLDHTAKRATNPVVSLIGKKGEEPEVGVSELEAWLATGTDNFIEKLKKITKKTKRVLENALADEAGTDDPRWLAACRGDQELLSRLSPFANFIRNDEHGYPYVISEGSVYVTAGTDRRSTGTHYTPPSLTVPIVKYTLEPLVYSGPAEGKPKEEWELKFPRELLELKICDLAVGSGAFLVQTCRYLSERLVEAWEIVEAANPGKVVVTPEGELSTGAPTERPIPKNSDERFAIARRAVADRCLYGVDINPMAIEMAKLSIWLITLQKGRPFEFLDHAIKWGDALLGCDNINQVCNFHLFPERGRELFGNMDFFDDISSVVEEAISTASTKRRELEEFQVIDIRDADAKARLNYEAERALDRVRLIGDAIVGGVIGNATSDRAMDSALRELAPLIANILGEHDSDDSKIRELRNRVQIIIDAGKPASQSSRKCFHWAVEFPEVFDRDNSGFDALVGNPPFQGGQKITGEHGTDYRNYLVSFLADGRRGSADLCAYFFLRGKRIIREDAGFGFLSTNTIAQGDTREVGLSAMVSSGITLTRAVQSRKWPGAANLEVSHVWGRSGDWNDGYVLDDAPVDGITPYLSKPGQIVGDPNRLKANEGKSFQGSIVLGMGFVMELEEAQALIDRDPKNKDVLFPFLNGEDLNSRPDQTPSRWVINFKDWPLDRSADGDWVSSDNKQRKEWLKDGKVPSDYPDPVAADYPDCLKIIEEKVKPVRAKNKRKVRRERWWQYAEMAKGLYSAIEGLGHFIVHPLTTKYRNFVIVKGDIVSAHTTVVIAIEDINIIAPLHSEIHWQWALKYGNKLENRPQYTPSDCFQTFPFPHLEKQSEALSSRFIRMRSELCLHFGIGCTELFNKVHDPNCTDSYVTGLRELQAQIDRSVANSYGWENLGLEFRHRESALGVRFTISRSEREEILDRLLALNHERYEQEVEDGLHDVSSGKASTRKKRKHSTSSAIKSDQYGLGL
jgi:hypothetical protein